MEEGHNLLDGLDDLDIPLATPGSVARPGHNEHRHEFFGPYQLIQQVGQGGVARVLRARHIHPQYAETTFAIKILHEELSRDPRVVNLFRHEAYVLSLLKHSNIVRTFEAGVQDERLFIAMEYIDGRDLDNMALRCQRAKIPVPLPVAMHIFGEVIKALAYAHELKDADGNRLNLVHRDVNPANVFLSYDGRVKLGDFGVASIAAGMVEKSREIAGKVGYFAPEQLEEGTVDERADIFALGVMMFELLTGTRLFEADSADKIMRLNKRAKIPKPSSLNPAINANLEAVMLKALERKPEDRFTTARDFLGALQEFIPPSTGMALAVAALMRKVFLNEHIQELQLREGLAGGGATRGSGQLVAVYTADPRAQAAFSELLLSRGYRCEICVDLPQLGAQMAHGPKAVVVDVGSQGFSAMAFVKTLSQVKNMAPLVAVSENLDLKSIVVADSIGAVDLLFKPFNIERVLTSVRAAITGAAQIAIVEDSDGVHHLGVRPRLLVVSRDLELIARITRELSERGNDVDVAPNTDEAVMRADHASYHAVFYDAHPLQSADRTFAAQFRGRAGMGLIPIVYLANPQQIAAMDSFKIDRGAVRARTDATVVLIEVLSRLWADTRLGRNFIRYSARFALELRYGGRVFSGEATDISRGGVMLQCGQMPPIGTEVGVSLKLPGSSAPVEVMGRVIRVDLPSHGSVTAGIGVEFERFASRDESQLISFLQSLDPSGGRKTLIMGAPPPATLSLAK